MREWKPFGSTDRQITVFTGPEDTSYALPVVQRFRLFEDVPLHEPSPEPVPLAPESGEGSTGHGAATGSEVVVDGDSYGFIQP